MVHVVLRSGSLSVDEPIQGSTPALRHPWLAHHTNPEVLVDHFYCWHYCSLIKASKSRLLHVWLVLLEAYLKNRQQHH